MITSTAIRAAQEIYERAGHLERDLKDEPTRGPAFAEIHEIRRKLNTLEHNLLDESEARGDAC